MSSYNKWLIVSILYLFCSCDIRTGKVEYDKSKVNNDGLKSEKGRIIPNSLLEVDTTTLNTSHQYTELLEENLFGRFSNDRAEFYIVKKPGNKMFTSNVQKITLYYIDGVLGKTKYELDESISTALIENYGSFKIMGLDSLNKAIIKERHVLQEVDGLHSLNSNINNFEMTWQKKGKVFSYCEVRNDSIHQFVFIEKLGDYNSRLRSVGM
jgi:hypothetical protein